MSSSIDNNNFLTVKTQGSHLVMQLLIQSFDRDVINKALEVIQSHYNTSKLIQIKVIRLPTNQQTFTVLRSPHVHKKSREQFQRHRRKLCIYMEGDYSSSFWLNVISSLSRLKLRGVQLSWKIEYSTCYK